jgi:septal ring factor EnvC (AmiA/AmiB activator)
MKKFITSLAVMTMIISFNGLTAQEKLSDENPEIARYTKALDLSEDQQKKLRAIYADAEMNLKQNKEEVVKLRQERTAAEKPVTQDEKGAWSAEMDESSKERRMLVEERNKLMLDILDDEQLAKYKEWREKKATEELEIPTKETKVFKSDAPTKH